LEKTSFEKSEEFEKFEEFFENLLTPLFLYAIVICKEISSFFYAIYFILEESQCGQE